MSHDPIISSLSGEIECSANDVSSITSRSFSEGEIRYRVKKSQNPNAISAPFEETISEESENDDPTDLQEPITLVIFEQNGDSVTSA